MNILIIGAGGREHALAWKCAQSPQVDNVFVAPGNAGTALEHKVENVNIGVDALDELLGFAQDNLIDLTIVGPEAPLVAGVVDQFESVGLSCFGPSAKAARLEGSKSFAKQFMQRHQIPTASFASFTDPEEALSYLENHTLPVVIKADGLAAGKGVIIADKLSDAQETVRDILSENKFGDAGSRVVIEEFLQGEEVSYICMVDGDNVLPMASSQDHKAAYDADQGPNTGGMGAYSPALIVDTKLEAKILRQVINPVVAGMAKDGSPYKGFLYAGLMIDSAGEPFVVEFNCRFGDPEAQPVLTRLESDLVSHCLASVHGELSTQQARWSDQCSLGVVLAADGYPDSYPKGDVIRGLDKDQPNTKVFHAGTTLADGNTVTSGGRVLCVTAQGSTIRQAQSAAYGRAQSIHWDGMWYRKDIGYRAIAKESSV